MSGAAAILAFSLVLAGDSAAASPVSSFEAAAPRLTVGAPAGRLARALGRLQGGQDGRRSRKKYRVVTLLGGKLTARVPN